jgi:hypothetical protein
MFFPVFKTHPSYQHTRAQAVRDLYYSFLTHNTQHTTMAEQQQHQQQRIAIRVDEDDHHHRELEEQRSRREIIIDAMDVIPNDMDFNEGCIFLNLLYTIWHQTKLRMIAWEANHNVNYNAPNNFREFRDFSKYFAKDYDTDSKGRIIKLELGHDCWEDRFENECSYNLPPIIEYLPQLKEIKLCNCRLIPMELSNLRFLEVLDLEECPNQLFGEDILEEIQLNCLKKIVLHDSGFLSTPMFSLIKDRLPFLECLFIKGFSAGLEGFVNSPGRLRDTFQNNDFCFQHSLKILNMEGCRLTEEFLETILCDDKFPNICEVDFSHSEISSYKRIGDRILDPSRVSFPKNCLRKLHTNHADLILNDKDPKENAALVTILNTFNGISFLTTTFQNTDSEVEYLLRINHAGRKFITGGIPKSVTTATTAIIGADDEDNDNSTNEVSSPSSSKNILIKPQLWPTILERAYNKSDEVDHMITKCATGMYYLIRNGSILQDIIAMRQHNCNTRNTASSCTSFDSRNLKKKTNGDTHS